MIKIKNTSLSEKEKQEIKILFSEITDPFCDFYVTKNNLRLFIRENAEIFFKGISKGDYIAWDSQGVGVIIGISDKSDRKYFRFLVAETGNVGNLLVSLISKYQGILFTKLKNNNPSISTLEKFGFIAIADRGEETLFKRDKTCMNS